MAVAAETFPPHHLRRRVVHLALFAAVVGALVAALPGLEGIREQLQHAHPTWLSIAVAAELASAVAFVVVLRAVFCPQLRWRVSYQLGLSELAANSLLPSGGAGGLALGAWSLARGGMSRNRIARRTVAFFLVTSAANFLAVVLAGAGVALSVVPGRAPLLLTIVPAVLAALAVAIVPALPRILPRPVAVSVHTPASGLRERVRTVLVATVVAIRGGILELRMRAGSRRRMAISGAVGYLAFDIATLAACLQAIGSGLPLGNLVLAYAIGQLGGIIPLPGGIGATEGGLIGAFVLYGSAVAPATAAVLLFRLVQLGVPLLLGAPAFVFLTRTLRRPEAFAADCGAAEVVEMGARTHGSEPG
jgi:uncharacterized membrane protein YbhN (UPF0104 family)